MADQVYKYLTAEERLGMLRPRLQDSERQHYEAKLNSKTQPSFDQAALTSIETRIEWLQAEFNKVEAEVASENAAREEAAPSPSPSA